MTTRTASRRAAPARPQRTPANRSRRAAAAATVATSNVSAASTVPATSTVPVVAIGDVHGCADLLEQELEKHQGSGAELILLGDLIDRAPEPDGDRRVLERIWALQQEPGSWGLAGVTVLRGNHEQMLLDALAEEIPGEATELWEWNGGDPNLLPFARQHVEWFAALPFSVIRGSYLFVHAGVRPSVPLEEQRDEDLIWIRRPFLSRPHGLPYTVVHGHTITRDHQIDRRPHRINLDTGAFTSGLLSSLAFAINSTPNEPIPP
jgi:serine/threonine protein phosphatase 1